MSDNNLLIAIASERDISFSGIEPHKGKTNLITVSVGERNLTTWCRKAPIGEYVGARDVYEIDSSIIDELIYTLKGSDRVTEEINRDTFYEIFLMLAQHDMFTEEHKLMVEKVRKGEKLQKWYEYFPEEVLEMFRNRKDYKGNS